MKTLFATAACLAATAAHAQAKLEVGPLVGETLTTLRFTGGYDRGHRFGLLAGAQASISRERFALQPALLIAQTGYTQDVTYYAGYSNKVAATTTDRYRYNYLTLPVNFVFAPEGTATGPLFFAGSYVSVLLSGTYAHTPQGQAEPPPPFTCASR